MIRGAVLAALLAFPAQAQQDAPPRIVCSAGLCIVPEPLLAEISTTLGKLREQVESYARMCNWRQR